MAEQDPRDEPPAEQLIQARRRLQKAAETTSRVRWKPSAPIALGDTEKDAPPGWVPARVNDTGLYINGLAFKPSDWRQEGLPIIRIQNLTDPSKEFNFAQGEFPDEVLVRNGDILVSWSATLEAFKWDRGLAVLNQHIFRVIPDEILATRAFLLLLLRHAIREMADSVHAHGLVMTHINRGPFLDHIVLIPPLAEQHRIVAKVDELMALCDRLEAAQTKREQRRDRLVAASLNRINQPARSAEGEPATAFREHARFHLDHLPRLTTRPEHIKSLRQTILNLAVRGQLVPQDPTGDLKNQSLIRLDKDSASYDQAAFNERAPQFPLPPSWTIEPLSRVCENIVDCPHTTPKWTESGVLCIRTNQVRAGVIDLSSPHFVSEETYQIRVERLEPRCDDILYIREGGVLGVGCRIPPATRLCLGQRLMLIRANKSVWPRFLELCLNSPWITDFAREKTTGGAAPRVNMSVVRGYPIPLPPLAEQHRIVAKVDDLMALCDQLEAQLTATQTDSRRLLDAVLHEALA